MKLMTHDQAVAYVRSLCQAWLMGYDGEVMDMAEIAALPATHIDFYRAGLEAYQREQVHG